jgi:hypothetical protein
MAFLLLFLLLPGGDSFGTLNKEKLQFGYQNDGKQKWGLIRPEQEEEE